MKWVARSVIRSATASSTRRRKRRPLSGLIRIRGRSPAQGDAGLIPTGGRLAVASQPSLGMSTCRCISALIPRFILFMTR
jgi:hypothetical protein